MKGGSLLSASGSFGYVGGGLCGTFTAVYTHLHGLFMSIRLGTSGWSYDHWHGVLYPHGAPPRDRLGYYLQHFSTVEVNSTFYRWPPDHRFVHWHRRLPEGFLMTVKAPMGLTHVKRLYAPENWLTRIKLGIRYLGRHRGIFLVQLSPLFEYDYDRLAYFLEAVPAWLNIAVEFRHPSWHREDVFALLEQTGAAYCVMSGAHLPCIPACNGAVRVRPTTRPRPRSSLCRFLLG